MKIYNEKRRKASTEKIKVGKKEFAVLPYEEFLRVQEELEDYDDLKELRAAKSKEANSETVALSAL